MAVAGVPILVFCAMLQVGEIIPRCRSFLIANAHSFALLPLSAPFPHRHSPTRTPIPHLGTSVMTAVCVPRGTPLWYYQRSVTVSHVLRQHTLLIPVVVVRRPAHVRQPRADLDATLRRRSQVVIV